MDMSCNNRYNELIGLVCPDRSKKVSLKHIAVSVRIQDYIACVVSRLDYVNEEKDAIEAEFIFPMDDDSAVYHFQVEIDGRVIIGECQEKKQAEETYNDAMSSGFGAFMMNEDENTGDIFQLKVGNLPSMKRAVVSFSYVIKLKVEENGTASFKLPTVLNPRYNPAVEDGGVSNPATPHHAEPGSIPYSLTFSAVITGSKQVSDVKATHVPITWQKDVQGIVQISLKERFKFEHDLELEIEYDNPHQSTALLCKGDTQQAGLLQQDVVMLNIFPNCDKLQSSSHMEFIFIVDRSGSMRGTNMQQAKDTLLLFLKSLPVGCYFNIISFGSSYSVLFPDGSHEYNETSLNEATDLQSKMSSDMGGTEILQPLKHMYENMKIKDGYPRQVFVLTDGGVSNTRDVINKVKDNASTTRVFTFGIGSGASTALVKGMARAGKGKAEFVTGNDRLQSKVVSCLKVAMQPSMTNVTITWTTTDGVNIVNVPTTCPVIFNGELFVSYGIIQGKEDDVIRATVSANVGDTALSECVEVTQKSHSPEFLVHRLAAKQQIKQLESDDGEHKNKMIMLSLASNIVCKHTAFVGVDRETKEVKCSRQQIPISSHHYMIKKQSGIRLHSARRMMPKSSAMSAYGAPPPPAGMGNYAFGGAALPTSQSAGPPPPPMHRTVEDYEDCEDYANCEALFCETEDCAEDCAGPPPPVAWRTSDVAFKPQKRSRNAAPQIELSMDMMKSATVDSTSYGHMIKKKGGKVLCGVEQSDSTQRSGVTRLIELQIFDGSWNFSLDFLELVGRKALEFKDKHNIEDASVAATLLAITWLEVKHGDTRDEWSIIADKAAAWLNTSMSLHLQGRGVDEWKQEAKNFI